MNFMTFVNENKKECNTEKDVELFNKDVELLLDDMFAVVKKPKYKYDDEGYAKHVSFFIDKKDFDLKYDDVLTPEYSEGVLKKRCFDVELVFDDKKKEDDQYCICFDIKKIKVDHSKIKEDKPKKDEDNEPKVNSKDEEWYGKE